MKALMIESGLVRGKQHVFNYISNYNDPTFFKDKLQHVFECLQCAAKNFVALGYVFQNDENGNYHYFYAL